MKQSADEPFQPGGVPIAGAATLADHRALRRRMVAALSGMVLSSAAALSGANYGMSPGATAGAEGSASLLPLLIAFEIFLGLWLISGALPRAARRVAIGCFSVFAQWFATTPIVVEIVAGKVTAVVSGRKAMGLQWMKWAVPWAR